MSVGWRSVRLRNVAQIVATAPGSRPLPYVALEHIAAGEGRLASGVDLSTKQPPSTGMVLLAPGDVCFGKLRPYLSKSVRITEATLASTELIAMRPSSDLRSRWLSYCVRSHPFVEWAVATSDGSKMPRTSWDRLGGFVLQLPPVDEQRRIADHLDAETARIDALIAKRQRQIELLEERSLARVEALVSRGNRQGTGASPRRGSFVTAPSEWRQTTLRHVDCSVQTGPFGSQLHATDYIEGGWPVVNPNNLRKGSIAADLTMTVSEAKRGELKRHVLIPGDIVFGRRGEMGRVATVTKAEAGWLCGTGSLRLRLGGSRLLASYLKLVLETTPLRDYFSVSSVGSTMENLNSEIVLDAPVLLPTREEQHRIVDEAHAERSQTAAVVSPMNRQIALLRERRQALITAGVTGQLRID